MIKRQILVDKTLHKKQKFICGISGKFSVLVRHFIVVPYIIDSIGISSD
jgi:hypothetical protein